ncbi:hypothetical protein [Pseudomonas protegens]|uniref:hypothetical protein n=1 Tax=Pseudomonas protegens TaxID=380021 RepID=UPI002764044A|nr:hypothetical protein [Pseudomonas protegens]MDP9530558.1 hypothetical protein [Pseudomonas protegens]
MEGVCLWEKEVIDFHSALEQWLGAVNSVPEKALLERLKESFTEQCRLFSPNGEIHSAAALRARIESSYGSSPDISIRISDFSVIHQNAPLTLVSYTEWRTEKGHENARLASVVFIDALESAAGVRWLHIHETWKKGFEPR